MTMQLRMVASVLACAALAACGGDSTADAGIDGSADAGRDMTAPDTGADMGDAGVDMGRDAGPMLQMCDATDHAGGGCPTGFRCAVTDHAPTTDGGMDTIQVGECVPTTGPGLVEGSTCGTFQPVPGFPDVSADPCGNGNFCRASPETSIPRCHPVCNMTHPCVAGQFCIMFTDIDLGFCNPTTNCNPLTQTGCSGGRGCYVVNDDTGALYTSCFAVEARVPDDGGIPDAGTGVPGDPCGYLGNCLPGNQCHVDTGATMGVCRAFCDLTASPDAGDIDAGDPDAGPPPPPPGLCASGSCTAFMADNDAGIAFAYTAGYCAP
jgi:hypothetical protein